MRPCYFAALLALLVCSIAAAAGAALPKEAVDFRKVVRSKDIKTFSVAALALRRWMIANDPHLPIYHFTGPESWINDANGVIYHKGTYHLFYQFDPIVDGRRSKRCWGHARSSDLVHWQDWPVAIWPDSKYDRGGVYSGNVVIDDKGFPAALYTGNVGGHRETYGMLARSTDGFVTWTKKMVMDNKQRPNARSPVHWDAQIWKDGGTWYQLIGGAKDGKGAAWLWTSGDLEKWTLKKPIYSGPPGRFWELPYLLPFGEKYVLMIGVGGNPYWVGTYDKKTMTFTPDKPQTRSVDPGDYYAVNPHMVDDKGAGGSQRRILHAWARTPPTPTKTVPWWQGAHSIPRVITVAGGRLIQEPIPELKVLRGKKSQFHNLSVTPESKGLLKGVAGDALEIIATFKPGKAGRFGVKVRVSPDGKTALPIWYDAAKRQFGIADKRMTSDLKAGESVTMRIFLDRSIVEVYVNGNAVTKVAYLDPKARGVELFAKGGRCTVESIDIWEMTSMWPAAAKPPAANKFSSAWPKKKEYADPAITKAMEAVRAATAKAAKDPTRPVYHFRPPAQWMNDICGAIYYKGYYHIFYQLNPFGADMWGVTGSSWGHARSKDLARWEHLPVAIAPMTHRGERRCNSGCVTLNGDGTPMIFYTFVPAKSSATRHGKREQWAAIALDDQLLKWRRVKDGPLMAAGMNGVSAGINGGWSDPFVFRWGGRTFVTFKSCRGVVCEAQNKELTEWKYAGKIEGVTGECPNFFPLGDKWVLLRSTYPPSYQVGRFDGDKMKFHVAGPGGTLDHAYGPKRPRNFSINRGFYGTNVLFDDRRRCVLFGWVSGFKTGRGWNGCMSLPRILSLDKDGHLIQTPAPELEKLRGKHVGAKGLVLNDSGRVVEGARGDTLEILVRFEPAGAKAFGLKVRRSNDGKNAVTFRYDGGTLDAAGTKVPLKLDEGKKTLILHVFLDKSVMEAFINGGSQCVTRVIYPGDKDLGIEVFSQGGKTHVKSIDIWSIKPIWSGGN